MPLLHWDEGYSVKVRELDQQHQHLFALINTLHEAMSSGRGKEVLGKVLQELLEYTEYHFSNEERLFALHGYPVAGPHKAEHDKLTQQVRELKAKFDSGQTQITVDVMLFLKNWLNHHIQVVDKKYGEFFNEHGVH